MTPQETVVLARYVRSLCPQQKFDEYTADAWHNILAPYHFEEAREAVDRHITSGNSFVSVGEIVTEIRSARNIRLDQHTEAEPPANGADPFAYRAALLNERRAIADGRRNPADVPALSPATRDSQPQGRVRAILGEAGKALPGPREGRVNVLAVPCRVCSAQAGRACFSGTRKRRRRADVHPTRLNDARRAAAGLPPADPAEEQQEIERRIAASRTALAALPSGSAPEPQDGFTPDGPTDPDEKGGAS